MNTYQLQQLLENKEILEKQIQEAISNKQLFTQKIDEEEMQGHVQKAEHNLMFINKVKNNFLDWAITGCYYACYHAALALIKSREYSSKSHVATLYILIKEFYKQPFENEDFKLLATLLDYEDVLFYVEAKNKREKVSYSTTTNYTKEEVARLTIQATVFVNKAQDILEK